MSRLQNANRRNHPRIAESTHRGFVAVTSLAAISDTNPGPVWTPASEDLFWRSHFRDRPYVQVGAVYEIYQPAYRYGWEASARYPRLYFEDVALDLEIGWMEERGVSPLDWESAKWAVRDGWDHTDMSMLRDFSSGVAD